jgi:hypothetical protein
MLNAMWSGSRSLYTFALPEKAVSNAVARACFSARIKFYSALIDIADTNLFPRKVRRMITRTSPFFYRSESNRICAVRPSVFSVDRPTSLRPHLAFLHPASMI